MRYYFIEFNAPAQLLLFFKPLMSECRHSACMSCWKDWLSRQPTCPQCRKHTELKTLAKMVFATDGKMDGGFTQICESESDNDELEIVA
jgi:hypothetical protein